MELLNLKNLSVNHYTWLDTASENWWKFADIQVSVSFCTRHLHGTAAALISCKKEETFNIRTCETTSGWVDVADVPKRKLIEVFWVSCFRDFLFFLRITWDYNSCQLLVWWFWRACLSFTLGHRTEVWNPIRNFENSFNKLTCVNTSITIHTCNYLKLEKSLSLSESS